MDAHTFISLCEYVKELGNELRVNEELMDEVIATCVNVLEDHPLTDVKGLVHASYHEHLRKQHKLTPLRRKELSRSVVWFKLTPIVKKYT